MADAPQPSSANQNRRRATIVLWVSVVMVGFLIFSLPTVIVFFFGMLPTFGAFVADRSKEKYAMLCVGSLNFCGIFPYLMDLWFDSHTIYAATLIMADVFSLVVMFGAAALGWVMYTVVPPVISSFLSVIAQQRVTALRTQQRTLIQEWGEGVALQVSAEQPAVQNAAQEGVPPSAGRGSPQTIGSVATEAQSNGNDNTPPQAAA